MVKTAKIKSVLEELCPLSISKKFIELGSHDNSGLLINASKSTDKIYTMLDLTVDGVKAAKKAGASVIITHHPAIYYPVSSLSVDSCDTAAVFEAIKLGISVFSMHLNLDAAENGIDQSLAEGVKGDGKDIKILNLIDGVHGYGREYEIKPTTLSALSKKIKKTFDAERVLTYGEEKTIKKVASFCGAGSSDAVKYSGDADLIITSDVPHHALLTLVNKGKCVLTLTHYTAESYGFKRFTKMLEEKLGNTEVVFFEDKRLK